MLEQQLERAAYSAWPALEQIEREGVVYRCANNYTKRANSANVLSPENWNLPVLLAEIEQYFKEKGQPSIVRLPSYAKVDRLDQFLEDSGYQYASHSLVMTKQLNDTDEKIELRALSASQWLDCFVQLSESGLAQHKAHLSILQRIKDKTLFAVLEKEGRAAACGIGVISQNTIGLFDLVCAQQYRGQGYGRQLIQGISNWGYGKGARICYLQVQENNLAAVSLYNKMGFKEAYSYWYRIKV